MADDKLNPVQTGKEVKVKQKPKVDIKADVNVTPKSEEVEQDGFKQSSERTGKRGRHPNACPCAKCQAKRQDKAKDESRPSGIKKAQSAHQLDFKRMVTFGGQYLEQRKAGAGFSEYEVEELSSILSDMFPDLTIESPYLRLGLFGIGYMAVRPTMLAEAAPVVKSRVVQAYHWVKSKFVKAQAKKAIVKAVKGDPAVSAVPVVRDKTEASHAK